MNISISVIIIIIIIIPQLRLAFGVLICFVQKAGGLIPRFPGARRVPGGSSAVPRRFLGLVFAVSLLFAGCSAVARRLLGLVFAVSLLFAGLPGARGCPRR